MINHCFQVAMYYIRNDLIPLLKYVGSKLLLDMLISVFRYMMAQRVKYMEKARVELYMDFLSVSQFAFYFSQKYIRNNSKQYFCLLPLDLRKELKDSTVGGLR